MDRQQNQQKADIYCQKWTLISFCLVSISFSAIMIGIGSKFVNNYVDNLYIASWDYTSQDILNIKVN